MRFFSRRGFTLLELMIVIGFSVILAGFAFTQFGGKRGALDTTATATRAAALLQDARARSIAHSNNAVWGVHFENGGANSFFALFSGTYSTDSTITRFPLPAGVSYDPETIPDDFSVDILFDAGGSSSASTTISFMSTLTSSTVHVGYSGLISY